MKLKVVFAMVTLFVLGATQVEAKDGGKMTLGIGGGYIIKDLTDGYGKGYQFGGRFDFALGKMLYLEVDGSYAAFKSDPSGFVKYTSMGGGAALGVKFGDKSFHPYISAGGEYLSVKSELEAAIPGLGSVGASATEKSFALQARIGCEIMLGSSVGLFLEGQYLHMFKSDFPRQMSGNGGLMFHF